MKSRRDFLRNTSLMIAGGLVVPKVLTSAVMAPSGKNVGLQLYSMRDMIDKSGIQSVLEVVSNIGYKNLEAAGYSEGKIYGLAPADFKKRVDDLGMKCTSSHLGHNYSKEKEAEVMKWWSQAIDTHHKIGVDYMIQASMPVNERSKLDELKTYCDYFSTVGGLTAAAGIAFGYHNHTSEFRKIGDQVILDFMLGNVNKDKVCFELDVYWCQEGGADPVEYLKKYDGQFKLTHIKDAKEIGASGKMDFKAIFEQMYANKIKDWYVEIEEYTNNDPVDSARQSFDFLKKARYVK
jgi:sugar phosphate isomerase/epimerase